LGYRRIDTAGARAVAPEDAATVLPSGVSKPRMTDLYSLSDRELTEAVLGGVPGAFERVVREHQTLCWHIAFKLTRDREEAYDLCQDIFLRVHLYLHQYRHDSALKTWIGRVAYTCALRHMERRRMPLEVEVAGEAGDAGIDAAVAEDDVHEQTSRAQIGSILHAHMRRLPPVQGLLLTLYHLDGLSIAEIASMTGMSDGNIKSHLSRGRARLRDSLATTLGARQ
jgi:RNA polymerase sigma-70 factor (ECF subfamily)